MTVERTRLELMSEHSRLKPSRLPVWGDSLLNKLSGLTRKRRKREASKKRRAAEKQEQRFSDD